MKGWDRQLEDGLPDCRLKERNANLITAQTVNYGRVAFERSYCANCGANGPLIIAGCPHVFFVCDPCFHKLGDLPFPEVDEETIRGKRPG